MTIARLGRWALPFILVFFFADVALSWQGRPPAAWSSGFCQFFGGWAAGRPGMIMGILLWILVCLAIVHLIRRLFFSAKMNRAPADAEIGPLNILKTRYARSEITVEEFQRMKKDLL